MLFNKKKGNGRYFTIVEDDIKFITSYGEFTLGDIIEEINNSIKTTYVTVFISIIFFILTFVYNGFVNNETIKLELQNNKIELQNDKLKSQDFKLKSQEDKIEQQQKMLYELDKEIALLKNKNKFFFFN